MKRTLSLILAVLMLMGILAACGEDVPAATEPAVSQPTVTKPVATEPTVTEPVATDPVPSEPELMDPEAEFPPMDIISNLLQGDPLGELDCDRTEILSVTFLDSLQDAPEDALDVSYFRNGAVLCWNKKGHVYIAADGPIDGSIACTGLFYLCENMKTVTFGDAFLTLGTRDMANMFAGCGKLTKVDLSKLDTSNVVDMSGMFTHCKSLKSLDLRSWNTASVVSLYHMFNECSSLTTVDLSGWNTSNVQDMSFLFASCQKLKKVDLTGWDTANVIDMSSMFFQCTRLSDLDLSHFDTSKVTSMADFMPAGMKIDGVPWEDYF